MERDLTAGEWAALGFLAAQPTHGFDLARALAPGGDVGRIWSLPRPLVYRAVGVLRERELVEAAKTEPSSAGPRRTVLRPTPAGDQAVRAWLEQPVEHVRDLRSLLLLKLLIGERLGLDATPLLTAQRAVVAARAERLEQRLAEAEGFERTLALWRREATAGALRFLDGMLDR
jgi:PadR family transcriptional regulator AphA